VLHDFDKSGFSIVHTLEEGARGSRGTGLIVDLGFRLEDIEGLEREPVEYAQRVDPSDNLIENGAEADEVEVLVQGGYRGHYRGERVELNAMAADQFVEWLEEKLTEQGVEKIVPADGLLEKAYRRARFLQDVEAAGARLRARKRKGVTAPASLAKKVAQILGKRPELTWDEAVWYIAARRHESNSRRQRRSR
jgi:hypothetical protein